MNGKPSLRIAMLHPKMGMGGAERVTLDAAVGLRKLGHRPVIFTHDLPAARSFDAARDGTVDVRVVPSRIPPFVRGRLRAPLAALRMAALARSVGGQRADFDVAYLDLVAHAAPILRARFAKPILFYCHYPDLLLTPPRTGAYSLYRRPIDALERRGLLAATRIVVNSEFTADRFRQSFPALPPPQVIYPGIEVRPLPRRQDTNGSGEIILLSVNRFVAAKDLPLAVRALAALQAELPAQVFARVRLVLAGGFAGGETSRVLQSIDEAAAECGVRHQISIVLNPSEEERRSWLARCRCVVYTPSNEHFGLGPVEAMAAGKPVLAAASGGPAETIADEHSGRLREPEPKAFASALAPWILDPAQAEAMGRAGRVRVEQRFSRQRFCDELESLFLAMAAERGS